MSLRMCQGLIPLVLLAGLAAPAAASGIDDAAGLFSSAAKAKANDIIADTRLHTHKDLVIATVNQLPPEKLKEYQALKTPAARSRFFRDLAAERAQQADVDGVYVLLCRVSPAGEPRHGLVGWVDRLLPDRRPSVVGHAVVTWPEGNDGSFTAADCEALDGILAGMGAHNHDQVLLEAVAGVRNRLEANARNHGAPPLHTFRWTAALWAAAGLVTVWAVLGLARARLAACPGGAAGVPGTSEVQAALFGAAAVLWLVEAYRARRNEPVRPAVEAAIGPPGAGRPGWSDAPRRPGGPGAGPGPWTPDEAEAIAGHDRP